MPSSSSLSQRNEQTDISLLDAYEPSQFMRKLDEELQPYYTAQELTMTVFVADQGDKFLYTLPNRCWNEKATVDFCAYDLLDTANEDMFDATTYTFFGRQLEDETKHYFMLAKIYEKYTKKKLKPKDIELKESQKAVFSGTNRIGDPIQKAVTRFSGEGGAYRAAKITSSVLKGKSGVSGEIGHAYEIITRDEAFHRKLGEIELEKFAANPENRENIRKRVIEMAAHTLSMYFDLYGFNEEASEIWKANYGNLSD